MSDTPAQRPEDHTAVLVRGRLGLQRVRLHNSEPVFVETKAGAVIINRQTGDFQKLTGLAALSGRSLNGEPPEQVYNAIYTRATTLEQFVADLNTVLTGVEGIQIRTSDANGFMRVRRIIPLTEQFNEKAFQKGTQLAWDATA